MLTAVQIMVAVVSVFVGATVFSTVGFGIGVTTFPILLLVFDPQTAVVVINSVSLLMFSMVIFQTRKHISVKEIMPLSVAGMLGVPVGVFLLSSVNASALRISISLLILLVALLAVFNVSRPLPKSSIVGLLVGFVVGVVLNSFGVGGALMVLALLARDMPRQALRGSLSFYFLLVEGLGVVGYGLAGLFTQERILLTLIVALPVVLGFGLATIIGRHMSEGVFRKALLTVIIATSLVVLGREVISL